MGCAGSTAVHAGKMAGIKPGDWVVVQGVGGVGFALLQYALAAGARVIAIGMGEARLAMAKQLGATATIDAAEVADPVAAVAAITGEGADVVFELVGTEATMAAGVNMLRRRGRFVFIGYTAESFKIHPIALIVKELQLLGSVGATLQDLYDIVALVAQGKIRPVTDMVLNLEAFETGLQAIEARALVGRAVLVMD
jgi:propanol-preferring alcohol dehydrogenase